MYTCGKDVQSVLEVIEGTRLYLAVVLLLMVGLSYFLEKMSKASTEKKAKQSDYQLLESQREFVANISHELKNTSCSSVQPGGNAGNRRR